MSVERAERTPAVTVLIGLIQVWHVQVSGRQEEFGRVCLQVKKKTHLISPWFMSLHLLRPGRSMMCNFHTEQPFWVISRHFLSGDRCVLNSQYLHACAHWFFFLQCCENVIESQRNRERLMAGMLMHIGTFEIVIIALSRSVSLEKSIIGVLYL